MTDLRQGEGDDLWRADDRRETTASPRTRTAVPPPPSTPAPSAPPPLLPSQRPSRLARLVRSIRLTLRMAVVAGLVITAVFAALIIAYRFVPPPASTLMLLQRAGGEVVTKTWVPLDRISPHLVRAVIMSEDASFCRHSGVDWKELMEAIDRADDGIARGGSTISMQTAKNLFLWPAKSYVRKAIEIPLTLAMEVAWPKARMLEIYLNIVEWGPGIFGAEAAARHHFGKAASRLNEREAALLAVSLPAPLVREPGNPSAQLNRMAETIRTRVRAISRHASCVMSEAKG